MIKEIIDQWEANKHKLEKWFRENELKEYGFEICETRKELKEKVLAWMPIPSFDEILEANRDVLERIKEKGD